MKLNLRKNSVVIAIAIVIITLVIIARAVHNVPTVRVVGLTWEKLEQKPWSRYALKGRAQVVCDYFKGQTAFLAFTSKANGKNKKEPLYVELQDGVGMLEDIMLYEDESQYSLELIPAGFTARSPFKVEMK